MICVNLRGLGGHPVQDQPSGDAEGHQLWVRQRDSAFSAWTWEWRFQGSMLVLEGSQDGVSWQSEKLSMKPFSMGDGG